MISFLSYRIGAFLAGVLPESLARPVTRLIAFTQYHARSGTRRNVCANLRIVMGDSASEREVNTKARSVFSNFARAIYCFFRIEELSGRDARERCDYQGIDEVVARLREKGGFLVVGPHVGPWEIGGALLGALGLRIHTVALDHPSAKVTGFFDQRRRAIGITCHPMGAAFSSLCSELENGSCVALLIDRAQPRGGRTYPLFGRDVVLPAGHTVLAVRCGVPVLTAACVFAPGDRFKFVYNGPHYPDASLDEDARADDLHRRCREDMQRFIREYPDQWFHFDSLDEARRDE